MEDMPPMLKTKWIVLLSMALTILLGCGGGGTSGPGIQQGTGTMAVRLADAPDPTITAIHVTIDRVQAHVGSQWVDITTQTQTVNLVDLVQTDMLLGSAPVPAGHYTQIRLYPSSVTVTDSAGTHDVEIGSAKNNGIKVNVGADVQDGVITTLLLDFDVNHSLIKQGNGQYRLKPVVRGVVQVLSGTITGFATDGTIPLDNVEVTAVYESGEFFPAGTEITSTTSLSDGAFKFWALLPGSYTLNFTWTSSDGTVTKTTTLTGVIVNANQNTVAGTVALT